MTGVKRKRESAKPKPPPKYKLLTIDKRLEVIRKLENGSSKAELAREYKTTETSIYRTWKNRENIKKQGAEVPRCAINKVSKTRHPAKVRMERLLVNWIEDCLSKKIPIPRRIIMSRAESLHKVVVQNHFQGEEIKPFKATVG